ncbi:Flp pilus assembly protein CpaB [Streptomyces sp. NBC_01387]|uniref:Flp pilus assembly protein CpaB n=1 Tax=unclassified Streptomyces TaxID=2593676 RepID=UPI002DDAE106|nr:MULTISPECIES: Flp pilus assembly protein CpaB [unclassified Streptomyces]WSC20183.1 Flp pilus assembly protein CpaB [Streptomyces sp. NBC_01766]WSV54200.1 Flp pilus assembly protein CpaB [Streptomyces sp. NBC_01014]
MNSRQRRGVVLLLLSALCAIAAVVGVLSVIRNVNAKVGPEVTAYRVRSDIAPYQQLTAGDFEETRMPRRWLSDNAVTDLGQIRGKIAVTPLHKGSLLQTDMIVRQPELAPGEQEIAIMIDASTGVAGKITPGSSVNIYATFKGDGKNVPDTSKVIVSGARVVDVGKITALDPNQNENDRTRQATDAVPITFALKTLDAQRVAYAESFATHVRLALVAAGGGGAVAQRDRTYTLDGDK